MSTILQASQIKLSEYLTTRIINLVKVTKVWKTSLNLTLMTCCASVILHDVLGCGQVGPDSPVVGRICAPFRRQEIQIKKLVSNGKKTHANSSIRTN